MADDPGDTVDVTLDGDTFAFGPPRSLFQSSWEPGRAYDPLPDRVNEQNGFLFVDSADKDDTPISVIINWPALLEDE